MVKILLVEFKKCKKCQTNRVGVEWIRKSVNDVMSSNDTKTGSDNQNVLNRLISYIKLEFNKDGKLPCSLCLYDYGQQINDAVYLYKKQNYAK